MGTGQYLHFLKSLGGAYAIADGPAAERASGGGEGGAIIVPSQVRCSALLYNQFWHSGQKKQSRICSTEGNSLPQGHLRLRSDSSS